MPGGAYVRVMDETPDLQTELATLFTAHDLRPERRGVWWLVDGLYPAISAQTIGPALTVDIALNEALRIHSTYPASNGVPLFRDDAFPLLLSAFWNRHNPGRVTRQILLRDNGPWQVFTGPYLRQIETGERPPVPYLLFETVAVFLRAHPPAGDIHWLSLNVTVNAEGPYADIRLNNQRQPELETAICALDWLHDGRDYRLHNAVLLMRA